MYHSTSVKLLLQLTLRQSSNVVLNLHNKPQPVWSVKNGRSKVEKPSCATLCCNLCVSAIQSATHHNNQCLFSIKTFKGAGNIHRINIGQEFESAT